MKCQYVSDGPSNDLKKLSDLVKEASSDLHETLNHLTVGVLQISHSSFQVLNLMHILMSNLLIRGRRLQCFDRQGQKSILSIEEVTKITKTTWEGGSKINKTIGCKTGNLQLVIIYYKCLK